jgi:hypothetical protein
MKTLLSLAVLGFLVGCGCEQKTPVALVDAASLNQDRCLQCRRLVNIFKNMHTVWFTESNGCFTGVCESCWSTNSTHDRMKLCLDVVCAKDSGWTSEKASMVMCAVMEGR